jgi:hypothetical protein
MALVARSGRAKGLMSFSLAYSLLVAITLSIPAYFAECRHYDGVLRATSEWCNENLPPDSRILVQDAGFISFATHFHIIDAVGLKTPGAIELNRRHTLPSGGRNRTEAISSLAHETHPTHLIVPTKRSEITHLAQQLQALGWHVEPLKSFGPYTIYSLKPPDASSLTFSNE